MKIRTIFVAVLLLAAAGAAAAQTKAPSDPKLIDANGYQKLLEENRGKPLVVAFWATWCEPCRDEFPMLNELAKQYAAQGVKFVAVNLDDDGDLILMRRFLARYKPVFPVYRKQAGGEAAFRQAVMAGWSGALPASFFYGRNGEQAAHLFGEAPKETYEASIRTILTGSGPASR